MRPLKTLNLQIPITENIFYVLQSVILIKPKAKPAIPRNEFFE
jgi:hypothetical protein